VRADTGGIDWDRFTRVLDRKVQRRWRPSSRRRRKPYWDEIEVGTVLQKYHDNLYTFITQTDKADKDMCDIISIALVRVAQNGNMTATQEIIKLINFTIDEWIESCPMILCWQGNDYLIHKHIGGCIRRYHYSGSFIGYLIRTLEYAGRGLRPGIAYSLDNSLYSGKMSWGNRAGQNPETGELYNILRQWNEAVFLCHRPPSNQL